MSTPHSQIPIRNRYQRIIQLELNEISTEIVEGLVKRGGLPNFARLSREWSYFRTKSESAYEYLEPWIQWTTAHTGKSYSEHGIFRLSDGHKLGHAQVWESLSEAGIQSAIIGSMNAIRGETLGGMFFPDPWSKETEAYPEHLQPLWELISSKVQGHATKPIAPSDLKRGIYTCLKFGLPPGVYAKIGAQILRQRVWPKQKWRLAAIFDEFLFEIFQRVIANTKYSFYTLFLNSAAHYQHHYWRNHRPELFNPAIQSPDCGADDDPVAFGYRVYDRILGAIMKLAREPETLVIVASGLSQTPFTAKESEGGMNYYRLRDHRDFVDKLGLSEISVFPLMSRDWQIGSTSPEALQRTKLKLSELKVQRQALFQVSESTPGYLFLETNVTRSFDPETWITDETGKRILRFHDAFASIAVKSGHHCGIGSLWISEAGISTTGISGEKNTVELRCLYNLVLECLGVSAARRLVANA